VKTLYLVRHAKSSWADPLLDDIDRPLNNRGRRDAPRMGKRLRERELTPDLIFSSPAERAVSTSMLIAEKIRYDVWNIHTNARLYHATEDGLLAFTRQLNNANDEVMIVGHNPGLTDFVNSLAGKLITDNMPTCAVAGIRFDSNSWELVGWDKGKLLFYDFPKIQ
jgi:phosphohistidine phosphatase